MLVTGAGSPWPCGGRGWRAQLQAGPGRAQGLHVFMGRPTKGSILSFQHLKRRKRKKENAGYVCCPRFQKKISLKYICRNLSWSVPKLPKGLPPSSLLSPLARSLSLVQSWTLFLVSSLDHRACCFLGVEVLSEREGRRLTLRDGSRAERSRRRGLPRCGQPGGSAGL